MSTLPRRPRPLTASRHALGAVRRPICEPLEERRLLAGLTLITHGFQITGDRPGWLDSWQDAIAERIDPGGFDASRYEIFIGEDDASIRRYDPGTPAIDQTASGEVIVTLDWAERSNDFFLFGDGSDSTTDIIAAEVLPYLTSAFPALGITAPLAQLPVHLIGHSRGASFAAELARELGEIGAWVEQVTLLDPHPLVAGQDDFVSDSEEDPPVALTENVFFADNYWRKNGDYLDFNGEPVDGALNFELDGNILDNGGYSLDHSDVHLFYYGTIDLALNAQEDGTTVPNNWYAGHGVARDEIGFAYTRIAGGLDAVAVDFIGAPFGGAAARTALARTGPQWPNVMLTIDAGLLYSGDEAAISLRYQDVDTGATISAWLDTDLNPHNGDTGISVLTLNVAATGNAHATASESWTVADGLGGTYFVKTLIDDGGRRRFSYPANTVTIAPDQPVADSAPGGVANQDDPSLIDAPVILPALSGSERGAWRHDADPGRSRPFAFADRMLQAVHPDRDAARTLSTAPLPTIQRYSELTALPI